MTFGRLGGLYICFGRLTIWFCVLWFYRFTWFGRLTTYVFGLCGGGIEGIHLLVVPIEEVVNVELLLGVVGFGEGNIALGVVVGGSKLRCIH